MVSIFFDFDGRGWHEERKGGVGRVVAPSEEGLLIIAADAATTISDDNEAEEFYGGLGSTHSQIHLYGLWWVTSVANLDAEL